MSPCSPEIEFVDRSLESIRCLAHGWPSELCRWHAHEALELHLITATRGKVLVGDYIGEFGPGELFLIGPNLPHNWITNNTYKTPVPVRDRLIQFHQDSIDAMVGAFPEFRQIQDLLLLATSGVKFIGFDGEIAQHALAGISAARGARKIVAFLDLLLTLARHPRKEQLSAVTFHQLRHHPNHGSIGKVVDYIARHYALNLSVVEAANMAGMSVASFSRTFRMLTGNRYTEFVNRVRIGQACALLHDTEQRVSTICYAVGFQNLANFNRQFLRVKQTTPSKFRESSRRALHATALATDSGAVGGHA
ncbi:MAG: helix-turn-helix domain-containing protein [Gammaproteobacteria bacterium]|nr:helix-turn-helix domain-containing protein [Gammaproteobacteria bacterium]